jgi:hypothetical protein
MLKQFAFHVTQLEYIKGAMTELPTYRPDAKTVAMVDAIMAGAQTARDNFQIKRNALAMARGELRGAQAAAHAAVVSVYPLMKSVYREDDGSYDAIAVLPKGDRTPVQTVTRCEAVSHLWEELPNPAGQATPFVAGELTRAQFDALLAALRTRLTAVSACDQEFQKKEAELHAVDKANVKFIAAALKQGKAQFARGTEGREVIDAIPTPSNTPLPGLPVIDSVEDLGGGSLMLIFTALHATSFKVLHQAPGATSFSVIAENVEAGEHEVNNLATGEHKFKVVGVNSRGEGKPSAVTAFTVLAAAA